MQSPIGIFDSGVGGLTVARAILDQLPDESIYYVGDTARGPYGPLPLAQVRSNALDVMDHMVDEGVKALVIACNSASAAVLRDARERYEVPVVEVIQPAVRRAVAATRNGHVGVIGTQATVTSMAYDDAFAAAPHLRLTSQACPRFVEFVERGDGEGLVAVDLRAPIGKRGAKRKIKLTDTVSARLSPPRGGGQIADVFAYGRTFSVYMPTWAAFGDVVDIAHNGFYGTGEPRFARVVRRRPDLN